MKNLNLTVALNSINTTLLTTSYAVITNLDPSNLSSA